MQELQDFCLYSHSYSFCFGTKVILFFKFAGQTRHFMTRLDVRFVPNNNPSEFYRKACISDEAKEPSPYS